jgi:5-methylcytosine-specific restriction enzyme subunit McrC
VRKEHLVLHREESWFRLQPDLLVRAGTENVLVLDSKWKLLDGARSSGSDKYGLSQSDFYQLHAYGQTYLNGRGDVVLIYPKSDAFSVPLEAFEFLKTNVLRLWVLPFCLQTRRLLIPPDAPFAGMLVA